jgi:hypothetical protein
MRHKVGSPPTARMQSNKSPAPKHWRGAFFYAVHDVLISCLTALNGARNASRPNMFAAANDRLGAASGHLSREAQTSAKGSGAD